MFGIATADGRRGQGNLDWRLKATLFSLAGLGAGAACGAALGWLGSLIAGPIRIVGISLVAVAFAAAGLAQLRPRSRLWLWERDCETAQAWLRHGAARWAILNGASLGTGFLSRIGFISWYAVPLASVAFGSPALGAILYGAYGALAASPSGFGSCGCAAPDRIMAIQSPLCSSWARRESASQPRSSLRSRLRPSWWWGCELSPFTALREARAASRGRRSVVGWRQWT